MSANPPRTRSLPGMIAYIVGLGFIVAASALNVAHDRLDEKRFAELPQPLPQLYDAGGKSGGTTLLVAVGLSILTLGVMANRSRRALVAESDAPYPPTYYAPLDTASESKSARGMVLQTRRYMANPHSSSVTGLPRR